MSSSSKYKWPDNVSFINAADKDFSELDNSQRIIVFKAIVKVASNPKPRPDGFGKPLSGRLAGFYKIKLRDYGIRIIYRLVPPDSDNMNIVIIGMRADNEVYDEARVRI
ncbi:MAG: type II toxin-antitoxin system RelE/ParE family toxin [Lachnospiraceae bacterium]|nr:type II toxin-antitoxin system RelE/ParE family toxin [Lachnospiraceae bacterium]